MQWEIVHDRFQWYLIVWDCDKLEDTWNLQWTNMEVWRRLCALNLKTNPYGVYQAENDNGKYHAFYFLDEAD